MLIGAARTVVARDAAAARLKRGGASNGPGRNAWPKPHTIAIVVGEPRGAGGRGLLGHDQWPDQSALGGDAAARLCPGREVG